MLLHRWGLLGLMLVAGLTLWLPLAGNAAMALLVGTAWVSLPGRVRGDRTGVLGRPALSTRR